MHPRVERFLAIREMALKRGDLGLVRECNWELNRLGYVEPPRPEAAPVVETASVVMPGTAVPERPRRGRPPKPAA